MALCSTCANNILGYCPVFSRSIPVRKEAVEHDCTAWRMHNDRDVLQVVSDLIQTHREHADQWWCVRDMIEGELTVPPGRRAGALQVLWTAEYLDMPTRALIARAFIPF